MEPLGASKSQTLEVRFDRGTLVVQGPRDVLAALGGQGLLWDARVGVFRAPAHRHGDLVEVAAHLGLTVTGGPATLGPPRLSDMPAATTDLSLRPYQEQALDAWELAGRRGVVSLPTGAGKTHLAMGAIVRVGRPALVLVPTRVLLEQWARRIRESLGIQAALYGDGDHQIGPLTVCTFESAFRRMDEFGDRFDLLLVDEAHHFGLGGRCEALEMCTAHARLGLTATPPETPEAVATLDRLLGPSVFHLGLQDLAGTHLAPFERVRLGVSLDADEQSAYAAAWGRFQEAMRLFRRSRAEGRWADFVRAAMQSAAGRQALAGHREARRIVSVARAKLRCVANLVERHAGARTLAFTADNAAAYELSRALLIPALTCDIPRAEREDVLARFREGSVRTLVSARVLNEGIDVPEAAVGIVLGGSLGPREHVQRVGRLLRPSPGKVARVYEVVVRGTFEDAASLRRGRSLAA